MLSRTLILWLSGVALLTGCGTAKKVAVTSFRVIDAPARFVRDRIDPPQTTTTTTTTTETDVVNPGHPVVAPTPTPAAPRRLAGQTRPTSSPAASPRRTTATTDNRPTASPRPQTGAAAGFPTARPVPGRPGYVYSVDPNGGIVDVTGYKPGDKAKDPYTQQIFIVP